MADFPTTAWPPQQICFGTSTALTLELIGGMGLGGEAVTGAWPSSNLAIFVPVPISHPILATQMFVINGGTVSGNIDVGIYTAEGKLLISSGSTAQAGTSAVQAFNITDTLLNPGLYYLACAMNNTSGIIRNYAVNAVYGRSLGIRQMATAFALPSSATFAALASAYVPSISVTGASVI